MPFPQKIYQHRATDDSPQVPIGAAAMLQKSDKEKGADDHHVEDRHAMLGRTYDEEQYAQQDYRVRTARPIRVPSDPVRDCRKMTHRQITPGKSSLQASRETAACGNWISSP